MTIGPDLGFQYLNNLMRALSGGSSDGSSDQNVEAPNFPRYRAFNRVIATALLAGRIAPNSEIAHSLYEKSLNNYVDKYGSAASGSDVSGSDSSNPISDAKDYLLEYLQGMMTNQGKENEINRQFNSAEAVKNREFQANEARLQREWYEAMSNSAYTRAVADMKQAGINPILAYAQGGAASSGTGIGAGSAAQYTATGGDTISSLLSSVADVIYAMSGSSSSKINNAFTLLKMAGKLA